MKRYRLLLTIAALTLASCTKEPDMLLPEGGDDRSVRFSMSISAIDETRGTDTRAMSITDESTINTVDVLAFYQGGDGVYRYAYNATNIQRNDMTVTGTVKGYSAPQQFVVLVNASAELSAAGIELNEPLADAMRKIVCIKGDQGQWNAYNNSSAAFDYIPMYAKTDPVVVDANNKQIGTFPLIRMIARIDVKVKSGVSNFKLVSAQLFNQKTAGYVAYDFSSFSTDCAHAAAVPTANTNTGNPILAGTVEYAANYIGDAKGVIERSIYTYESPAYGESGRLTGTAIVIGAEYNGTLSYYRINLKTIDDGDATRLSSHILRNHLYHVEIQSVAGPGYEKPEDAYIGHSQLTATVTPWNMAAQGVIGDGQWWLRVDKDELLFLGEGDEAEIIAHTNYNPNPSQGYSAGVWVDVAEIEYTPTVTPGNEWLTLTNVSGADGDPLRTIKIAAGKNTSGNDRKAKVYIQAGNLRKVINIIQAEILPEIPDPIPDDDYYSPKLTTYVGAFWKADQTGERVIKIQLPADKPQYGGKWAVQVSEYGDFANDDIVFLAGGSADPAIYGSAPGDAENFQVNSASNYAMGKATVGTGSADGIIFRIGLKTKWNSSHPNWGDGSRPVRYAKVVVLYGTNYAYNRVLWLRQGEEADYLIHTNDVTPTEQSYVKKISPYNLTVSGMTENDFTPVNVNGGTWTAYPSQAGAFFQFAANTTHLRKAWHPSKVSISSWSGDVYDNSFPWNAGIHETCPTGYRRPAYAGGGYPASELGRSLMVDVSTLNLKNTVVGYLADGFFDRRTIDYAEGKSHNTTIKTVVGKGTKDAAYIGRLFYNSIDASVRKNASIFFPIPGQRRSSDDEYMLTEKGGDLIEAGYSVSYLTSAMEGNEFYYMMMFRTDNTNAHFTGIVYFSAGGASIRCVKE